MNLVASGKSVRLGAAVALAFAVLASAPPAAATPSQVPSQVPSLSKKDPIAQRVDSLIRRMTLEEKVGQMTLIAVARLRGDCEWTNGDWRPDCLANVFDRSHTGAILSGGGMAPPRNTPKDWAEMVNFLQKYAIEHHRLRIPILYGVDAVHGHNNVAGATIFPHQVGLGSSWNPALVKELGAATAKVVKATGPTWNYAPVSDLARDQRWGRYYETYAEDPQLAGSLAAAYVDGFEASGAAAATVKHFGAYGEPFNGHDRTNTDVSVRTLQDTHFPAYKAQIDAGVDTLMANSGAVNGIPATASTYLLTDVIRRQWGFDGVVVSDWEDVRALRNAYHLAADYKGAIAIAVNAGIDMAMEPYNAIDFTTNLQAAVNEGLVPRKRIDEAVSRILRLKFKQGLFDNPYVDASRADAIVLGADQALARRAATESMVLLKNTGDTLPIPAGKKIVVTGDSADSKPNQMGGWTIGWQGSSSSDNVPGTTVLAGLQAGAPSGTSIVHATSQAAAVGALSAADIGVAVIGESPYAEGPGDKEVPAFTAEQQGLISALKSTGKPVVVVTLTGRPLVLGTVATADAILSAWLPGSAGGNAVADLVYGTANPSGRLPVSWIKSTGDVPMYYQQLPGTNSGESSNYDPAYGFGHGLSYTTYAVNSLSLSAATVPRRGTLTVAITVANTGSRAGDMVVPVYAARPVSSVLVPPRWLAGFTRVPLAAGEQKIVRIEIPLSRFAVTPGDVTGAGRPEVLPGGYRIQAGDKSADFSVR